MELNDSNINDFWNNHTLNDFQQLAILKNVHSYTITSVCFLKDGRIASSSYIKDNYALIYNKRTFKIEIRIKEKKGICYMNVNKDGILITCLEGTFLNLYEIKGKNYKNIQTIKPYNLIDDIIGIFDNSLSIQKFIELKNGDIAILVWGYAISFYKKKKKSKKYSYLNKFKEKENENTTDLCELDNKQYCITLEFSRMIKFLDMNSKKVTNIIKLEKFPISDTKTQLLKMNKNDLFVAGDKKIMIIDIQKKEIIKQVELNIDGHLSSMYKLSNNFIIAGYWNNGMEVLEYDELKKEFKGFHKMEKKEYEGFPATSSIAIFNNKLIVAPYNNQSGNSSLIVYQLKNK